MAVIVPAAGQPGGAFIIVRTVTAQASVGQRDWFNVPQWARYMVVDWDITATAGTTPISTLRLLSLDPVSRDDTTIYDIGSGVLTSGVTSTAHSLVYVGPGVSGIADDVALGAGTGVQVAVLNTILPRFIGFDIVNDRTTGDETYTYNLSASFKP